MTQRAPARPQFGEEYGIFYDGGTYQLSSASEALVGNAPIEFVSSGFNINGYTSITPGNLGPATLYSIPVQTKWQSVQQFNLTVQHEFPGKNLLSVAYVGTLGHHLPVRMALEQIPIGVTTEKVPVLAGTAGCDSSGNCNVQSILENKQHSINFFVPYQDYSTITSYANYGNSNYNALQAVFNHPFGHGLLVQAAYSWSHALDDSTSAGYTCIDSTDLARCYGNGDYDRRQSLVLSYVYSLPFFNHPSSSLASRSLAPDPGGLAHQRDYEFLFGPAFYAELRV